jgi:hypothetical protein
LLTFKKPMTLKQLHKDNIAYIRASVAGIYIACLIAFACFPKTLHTPAIKASETLTSLPVTEPLVTPTITPNPTGVPTRCDYDAITYIRCAGEKLGMSNKDIMKAIRIAKCESSFEQYAKNPNSTAKGIYQFIDSTWRANCLKDGNVYDFVNNIDCFWKIYKVQGDNPWLSSVKCWNK